MRFADSLKRLCLSIRIDQIKREGLADPNLTTSVAGMRRKSGPWLEGFNQKIRFDPDQADPIF